MKSNDSSFCFSAYVGLALYAQGRIFDVAKTGPERVVIRDDNADPHGAATLVITIGRTTIQSPITIDDTRCNGGEIGYIAGLAVVASTSMGRNVR
jgi:hypothetical protein